MVPGIAPSIIPETAIYRPKLSGRMRPAIESSILFHSRLSLPGGRRPVAGAILAGRTSGGLHASRDSLYRTARGEKQHRPRGDPLGPPPEAMSGLPRRYDHRPWTAAPPGPR